MSKLSNIAALMVDVQLGSIAKMDRDDAQAYLNSMIETIRDLRRRDIPIVWISMADHDQIYTSNANAQPQTLSRTSLDRLHFYHVGEPGMASERINNFDIFYAFMTQEGPQKGETVFCKSTFGAFEMPNIDGSLSEYLNNKEIRNLLVMGTTTQVCCLKTAIGASSKGFNAHLVSDRLVGWTHQAYDTKQGDRLYWGDDENWHRNAVSEALEKPAIDGGGQLYSDQERSVFHTVKMLRYTAFVQQSDRLQNVAAPATSLSI